MIGTNIGSNSGLVNQKEEIRNRLCLVWETVSRSVLCGLVLGLQLFLIADLEEMTKCKISVFADAAKLDGSLCCKKIEQRVLRSGEG